jgi:hypothetical protein
MTVRAFNRTFRRTILAAGLFAVLCAPIDGMDMPTTGSEMPPLSALKPAEGASVKILTPYESERFAKGDVPLAFKMQKGRIGSHVHAYIDGKLMGMFESEKGTLTGIAPGRHTLELRVATKDHNAELRARDSVEFFVQ